MVIAGLIQQGMGTINAVLAILFGTFVLFGYSAAIAHARRAEALLAGEKRLLGMIASGQPLLVILDALCKLLDATADRCSSGILLLDRGGARAQRALGPSPPSSYSESLEGHSLSSTNGPCAMAASLKAQVIVSDVVSDRRWDSNGWPALALAHKLRSCWSSPIVASTGEPLGAFAIYQRHGESPTPFHQMLIQKLTHIASIAIERARSRDALARSGRLSGKSAAP